VFLDALKLSFAELCVDCLRLSKLLYLDNLVSNSRPSLFPIFLVVRPCSHRPTANGDGRKTLGENDFRTFRTRLLTAQPYSARFEVAPFNGHAPQKKRERTILVPATIRRWSNLSSFQTRMESDRGRRGTDSVRSSASLAPHSNIFNFVEKRGSSRVQENCRLQLKAPSDNRVCRSVSRATLPLARWPFIRPVSRVSCREAGALLFRAFATRRGKAQ